MTNILDVRKSILEKDTIIVDIYDVSNKIPHLIGKTSIKPFKKEMEKANNVSLFLDQNYNITGGQIGLYDAENGLHVMMF